MLTGFLLGEALAGPSFVNNYYGGPEYYGDGGYGGDNFGGGDFGGGGDSFGGGDFGGGDFGGGDSKFGGGDFLVALLCPPGTSSPTPNGHLCPSNRR